MRPRRVTPGRTYLITRRCSDRRFFLRPSPTTNQIFEFVSSVHMEFNKKVVVRRPKARYYKSSAQPESVELEIVPPPGMDAVETRKRIDAAVAQVEREQKRSMREQNRKFLGERRVCRQDPYDNPTSWEQRRGRNPTFASRDKWARIEASQRNRTWLQAYREAREKFIAGMLDVVFPGGTWAMVRLYGCRCAAAG